MSEHQQAVKAAGWLNKNSQRVRVSYDNNEWTRGCVYIAPDIWSYSVVTDTELIAEAKRLGWEE